MANVQEILGVEHAGAVSIRMLDGFDVRDAAGQPVKLPGRKAQALLVYLILQPSHAETRERLATLLWPDRFDDQARHSLRQSVLTLRKALGDDEASLLQSEADKLSLDVTRFSVDALEFDSLAKSGTRGDLETALSLYRAPLMDGFTSRGEDFDRWLAERRDQVAVSASEAFVRLAQLRDRDHELDLAIAAAEAAVSVDPIREEAHRQLMSLLARAGRRADALKQFAQCEEILRRELDVAPEEETVRLAAELRNGDGAAAAAMRAPWLGAMRPIWRRRWYKQARIPLAVVLVLLVTGAIVDRIFWSGVDKFLERASQENMAFPLPSKPSIVVLPFEDLSDQADNLDLIHGIAEEITTALSRVASMFVIAPSTALAYGEKPSNIGDVAEQLGVRFVLDGTVQTSGARVRVSARLVDALEGHVVWAQRYEREMQDIFALQDEIALKIITALEVEITEGEQHRIALIHGTDNLQAWIAAGQALQHLRRFTPQDNALARSLYQRSIALDADYPGAWEGLAWTHFIDARFSWTDSRERSIRRAAELAQKTLDLDPSRPPTYALLGGIQLLNGDFGQAAALAEKATTLSPNGADVTAVLALILTYTKEQDRSVALLRRAMRLSPNYPDWYRWTLGRAYRLTGQYAEAEQALTAALDEDDRSLARLVELAATYGEMHRVAQARQVGSQVLEVDPSFSARGWAMFPAHEDPAVARRELAALHIAGLPD